MIGFAVIIFIVTIPIIGLPLFSCHCIFEEKNIFTGKCETFYGYIPWYYIENDYCRKQSELKNQTVDWQVYRNLELGFEVKYPRDWQFVTDPNFMFTYSGKEGPDFVFELQGKQELLKEFATPSFSIPSGLEEKYKKEGIVAIIPDLISIMIYKNEKNLSIADFVKEKFGYLDNNFVGQLTLAMKFSLSIFPRYQ